MLSIEAEHRGLIVTFQVEVDAVVHPPFAGRGFGCAGGGFAFDRCKFVFRGGIEALELQQREQATLFRRDGEGENDGLRFVGRDGLRRRKFAVVTRANEAIEVALHDCFLYFVIRGDEALGGGELFVAPFIEIVADAE